jgi:hypothetical protein
VLRVFTVDAMNAVEMATADAHLTLQDLYRQHAPRALGLAFLLTADWHLAEDLVQEAFVRVAGRFRHLRDPSGFEAYLRRSEVTSTGPFFEDGSWNANTSLGTLPLRWRTIRGTSRRGTSWSLPFVPCPPVNVPRSCCGTAWTCPKLRWPTPSGALRARRRT